MVNRRVGGGGGGKGQGGIRGLHVGSGWAAGAAAGKGAPGTGDKNGFSGPMAAPWRKTVSIFKQPVTLVRTTAKETKPAPQNEITAAANRGKQDKPKQVFWAKRLEGLRAMRPSGAGEAEVGPAEGRAEETETSGEKSHEEPPAKEPRLEWGWEAAGVAEAMALPARILPVGPDLDGPTAAASLASALQQPSSAHSHCPPITGQTNPKKHLELNPGVYTNPDQPLIHAVVVSDSDVASQQQRVLLARKRLEEAIKHFG